MSTTRKPPRFATAYPNLALERLDTTITACSDDFFAPATRAINADKPIFIPGKYDLHGKWMDGWETRRRRHSPPDHDWLTLQLGATAKLYGVNICTSYFTGNYPTHAALDACTTTATNPHWQQVLSKIALQPDTDNYFALAKPGPWRQLQLRIYPDGGIARLRVYGLFIADKPTKRQVDLASILRGGRIVGYSNAHFGQAINLLLPDKSLNMGDGWETARRRGHGHDWVVIELGTPGTVSQVLLDTHYFKGNYPASCDIRATATQGTDAHLLRASARWSRLIDDSILQPDARHKLQPLQPQLVTHLRLNIYPDGGVSRLRIMGKEAT